MSHLDRITIEPGKRGGKPCIRGLRMTVSDVLDYLASGMTEEELLQDFPDLTREDIRACHQSPPIASGDWWQSAEGEAALRPESLTAAVRPPSRHLEPCRSRSISRSSRWSRRRRSISHLLCGGVTYHTAVRPGLARRHGVLSGLGWHYRGPRHLPRQAQEVLVEDHLREAPIRLIPEVATEPDRADIRGARFARETWGVGKEPFDGNRARFRVVVLDWNQSRCCATGSLSSTLPWLRSCSTPTAVKSLEMEHMEYIVDGVAGSSRSTWA